MKRSKDIVSRLMRNVRSENTKPEIVFRKALWRAGFRYRKNTKSIIGKPDISNIRYKIAIFIDGDFWHGNQYKLRGFDNLESQFKEISNKEYWLEKIKRNIKRDRKVTNELEQEGWLVIRIWESQIVKNFNNCINSTLEILRKRQNEID